MPGPYQPSRHRAPQAQPDKRLTRRQVVWLSPLVALLPIAVVLAANAVTQSGAGAPGAATPATAAPAAQATPLVAANLADTRAPAATAATAATASGATVTVAAIRAATATPTPAGQNTAALAPTEPRPTQTNPPYIAYTVQPNDTIASVAQHFGVPAASVAQASGLRDADLLHVGQVLTVPRGAGWLYRVQPGETLDQIAARMGVPADKIAEASGQQAASIRPGYVLLIPDQPAPDTAK